MVTGLAVDEASIPRDQRRWLLAGSLCMHQPELTVPKQQVTAELHSYLQGSVSSLAPSSSSG